MSKFEIPKKNWKSIPVKSAEFILNESKDYVDYTLKASEKVTNRSYSMILILIGILSAIGGYTFDDMVTKELTQITYLNIFFIITIVCLITYLSFNVFPNKIMVKGRIPKELARKEFLVIPNMTPEENYLMYVIQEIENVQHKIDYNQIQNMKLGNKMKIVMYAMVLLLPIYLISVFFVVNLS